MPRIASLDSSTLPAATHALGRPIRTAADLAEIAHRRGMAQVWIHPSAHAGLGLPDRLPRRPELGHPFIRATGGTVLFPGHLSHWLAVTGAGSRVDLAFPAWDASSGLHEAVDGAEIVEAVSTYNKLLGISYRWSPGATAVHLIRVTHRGPGAVRLDASGEHPPAALDGATESDFRWYRPPDLLERGRRWVYGFDVNGQYLAACSSAKLGFGEPEHLIPHRGPLRFDPSAVGYWRVFLNRTDPRLPDPWDAGGLAGEYGPSWHGWATTPTVALAADLGALVSVEEAFLYPIGRRYLTGFYERLRDARERLLGAPLPTGIRSLALGLVKRTYTIGIGYLAGHFREPGEELYRPDWRHAIIGRARANLYRRLRALPNAPFAVDVDAFYMASDAETPEEAAPGLPFGSKLGEFTFEGRAPMETVLDVLNGDGAVPAIREAVRA